VATDFLLIMTKQNSVWFIIKTKSVTTIILSFNFVRIVNPIVKVITENVIQTHPFIILYPWYILSSMAIF